jgi:hypothetical protein
MTATYQPELGQLIFGANFHEIPLAGYVQAGLRRLGAVVAPESDSGLDPVDNSGASFENAVFSLRAFCWCDGESPEHAEAGCPPNFAFVGGSFTPPRASAARVFAPLIVDWYKYLGRGSTQDRSVSAREWSQIEAICLASVPGSGVKAAREALVAALAAVSPWPASVSVGDETAEIFLSLELPAALEPDIEHPDGPGIEALVEAAEAAIAAAVSSLGWGPPVRLGKDERYWLAIPFPPDFDEDMPEAGRYWREIGPEALAAFRAENEREPFSDERWIPIHHSAINLRRGLPRA